MPATTSAHAILSAGQNVPCGARNVELWELIERYRSDLVNQGYAILGNLSDAEETAQETFCEAFQQKQQLNGVQSVGAWLRAINRSNALNRLRSRRRNARKESRRMAGAHVRQFTTGGFSALEIREAVTKAIEQLPEEQRRPIVLHYWEHLNYDQIAERLNTSPRTVRRLVREAYLSLYKGLTSFLSAEPPSPREDAP